MTEISINKGINYAEIKLRCPRELFNKTLKTRKLYITCSLIGTDIAREMRLFNTARIIQSYIIDSKEKFGE